MIIGLCGKSGSGKSTIARRMVCSSNNTVHCDIDKIGHDVIELDFVKEDLLNFFGNSILKKDVIDRSALSKIVFSDESKMKELEKITWKHMKKIIDEFISQNIEKIIILDWALLYKTEYFKKCDLRVLVDVPYEIRKERAIKRDLISDEKFNLRERASIDYDKNLFNIVLNDNIDELRKVLSL